MFSLSVVREPVDLVLALGDGVLALGGHQRGQLVGQRDEVRPPWPRSRSRSAARRWPRAVVLRTTATAPSAASRSSRLAISARPFSRSHCAAASMSPSFSSRARLASIIPAPVAWRSAWTSLAVNVGHAQASVLAVDGAVVRSGARAWLAGRRSAAAGASARLGAVGGGARRLGRPPARLRLGGGRLGVAVAGAGRQACGRLGRRGAGGGGGRLPRSGGPAAGAGRGGAAVLRGRLGLGPVGRRSSGPRPPRRRSPGT